MSVTPDSTIDLPYRAIWWAWDDSGPHELRKCRILQCRSLRLRDAHGPQGQLIDVCAVGQTPGGRVVGLISEARPPELGGDYTARWGPWAEGQEQRGRAWVCIGPDPDPPTDTTAERWFRGRGRVLTDRQARGDAHAIAMGQRVAALRASRSLRPSDVWPHLPKCTAAAYRTIEKGQRRTYPLSWLIALSDRLHCSIDWLVTGRSI